MRLVSRQGRGENFNRERRGELIEGNMATKEEAPSAAEIKWNEKAERFETEDKKAFLQYHLAQIGDGKTVMDMAHTFVPPSKRGMGLAAKLCDAAFAHAQSRSLPVIPTCSYISVCVAAAALSLSLHFLPLPILLRRYFLCVICS